MLSSLVARLGSPRFVSAAMLAFCGRSLFRERAFLRDFLPSPPSSSFKSSESFARLAFSPLSPGARVLASAARLDAIPLARVAPMAMLLDELLEGPARCGGRAYLVEYRIADDVAWDELVARQVALARRTGALSLLPVALDEQVHADLFCGRLVAAKSHAAEAAAVLEATGSHLTLRGPIALAIFRGDEAEGLALIESRRQDVLRRGEGFWLASTDWGSAVLYNGLGRYDDALAAAERAAEDPHGLGTPMWLLADLVEAAVHSGNPGRAAGPAALLAEIAEANGTDWALGLDARSRAMLGEGDAAEQLYREAIERLGRTRIPVALGRTQLVYGEWLRRENRRVDAREQLRAAHAILAEAGMDAFAERARRELLATGETVRKRSVETLDDLTPQEGQIARLAATGHTNPEIGAQLFLSPRTVEWHLRKVFGKLGITSRRQLRTALPDGRGLAAAPV